MAYIPHSVMASAGAVQGVVTFVREDYVSTRTPKSKFFVDVSLVGAPGGRTLYRVRYLGAVTITAVGSDGVSRIYTTQGAFDELFAEAADDGVGRLGIRDKIIAAISGQIVNPIKVGGRWMIR